MHMLFDDIVHMTHTYGTLRGGGGGVGELYLQAFNMKLDELRKFTILPYHTF